MTSKQSYLLATVPVVISMMVPYLGLHTNINSIIFGVSALCLLYVGFDHFWKARIKSR